MCVCVCVCLIVQNVSECVCVVNHIVCKMSYIIPKKIKVSKIKFLTLVPLIIVIHFLIFIVYFRHIGYIYGVQRAA